MLDLGWVATREQSAGLEDQLLLALLLLHLPFLLGLLAPHSSSDQKPSLLTDTLTPFSLWLFLSLEICLSLWFTPFALASPTF